RWRRRGRIAAVLLTHDAQRAAQIFERARADDVDAVKRLNRAGWVLAPDVCAHRCLRADRGDVVRDQIVDVARDPQALLVNLAARLQLLLALGSLGPLAHRAEEFAVTADRLADGDPKPEQRYHLDDLARGAPPRIRREDQRDENRVEQSYAGDRDRPLPRAPSGDQRVQRDHDGRDEVVG